VAQQTAAGFNASEPRLFHTTRISQREEARFTPRQARGLPAIAGRGVVGAPGSSRLLPIPPAPPKPTTYHRHDFCSAIVRRRGRRNRDAQRAGGWGGDSAQSRASCSRTQPLQVCHRATVSKTYRDHHRPECPESHGVHGMLLSARCVGVTATVQG
jgi:hypothetical protein